jgi:hypothetical protein
MFMKIAKLVIGVISCVLFLLIVVQSCAAGASNVMSGSRESSGAAGFFLAICLLVAGIVGMATRNSKGGGITSGVFYTLGGFIGIIGFGTFKDLLIWAILSFIFAGVFILGSIFMKKTVKTTEDRTNI